MPDRITVSALTCHLATGAGPSAFGLTPPPPCPVEIDIDIYLRPDVVPHCVDEDDMRGLGVNYSSVSKAVYAAVSNPSRTFACPAEVLSIAAQPALELPAVTGVKIAARLPRALLQADCAEYVQSFSKHESSAVRTPTCTVRGLRVSCIIGLHPHERAARQRLVVDVAVSEYQARNWSHIDLAEQAFSWLEKSEFGTLESLADSFARHLLSLPPLSGPHTKVDVTIQKPSALPFATPSIRVTRTVGSFQRRGGVHPFGVRCHSTVESADTTPSTPSPESARRVFVAVGSNVGDRVGHIRRAVRALRNAGCVLRDTSRLYESEPMYVEEQDRFLNGVVEVKFSKKKQRA